jgi:hypothetical protein
MKDGEKPKSKGQKNSLLTSVSHMGFRLSPE